jgi:ParB family chromosome partitioning protein
VQGDQCLDSACYLTKVTAHIGRELAARPHLVQIETTWRPAKEQRPGALQKHQYRELDVPDNPDAEPPCPNTKSALIVFGRHAGKTITICTEDACPVHNPAIAAQLAKHQADNPAPVMAPVPDEETGEEAEQREAEYVQRRKEYEEEQQRLQEERAAERKAEFERQQKEHEAEVKRREKQHKTRLATLERIIEHAPEVFNPAQLRTFTELLLNLSPYGLFEDAAEHFVGDDENNHKSEDEILTEALANCPDDKLMGFVLRLLLTEHVAIPHKDQPDWLTKAECVFAGAKPKAGKSSNKKKSALAQSPEKKNAAKKKAAA